MDKDNNNNNTQSPNKDSGAKEKNKQHRVSGVKVIDLRKQIRLRDVRAIENLERAARAKQLPGVENISMSPSDDSDTRSNYSKASNYSRHHNTGSKPRRRHSKQKLNKHSDGHNNTSTSTPKRKKPHGSRHHSMHSLHGQVNAIKQQLFPLRQLIHDKLREQERQEKQAQYIPLQVLQPQQQPAQQQQQQPQPQPQLKLSPKLDTHKHPGQRSGKTSQHGLRRVDSSGSTAIRGQSPDETQSNASKNLDSVMNTRRLRQDGRKVPDDYRRAVEGAATPSQVSLRNYSEYYAIPESFNTIDDVFHYRGYKKLAKIDEGAFGVVSKAMRLSDKEIFAVKEIDLRRKRAKRIQEMKRELFVLQKVDNKHVVKLIEHFVVGQTLVIVMEFCGGNNLTAYLKDNAINEQESIALFKQMAISLKILHRKCIAHRDVKLNNFLLDSTRTLVKIADFGLSVVSFKQPNGILMAKTYCGTEPYMAPEILKRNSSGVRCYNPLYADIWSLGICLYAMLTRTFPFRMHTSQDGLLKAQVTRRWRFPRSLRDALSEEIKDIAWHMLDPEPERRITIIGVLAHPWLNQHQLVPLTLDEGSRSTTPATAHNSKQKDKDPE